jgi:hypothetical protein
VHGQRLGWRGKLGFVGATTEAIYELRMGDLGERFIYFPLPPMSLDEDMGASMTALDEERASLEEVRQVVHQFMSELEVPANPPKLSENEKRRIVPPFATWSVVRCLGRDHAPVVQNMRMG